MNPSLEVLSRGGDTVGDAMEKLHRILLGTLAAAAFEA